MLVAADMDAQRLEDKLTAEEERRMPGQHG